MGDARTGPRADQATPEQRFTVAGAAEVLGTSAEAIRSRIKRGTLPSLKEGSTVYVILDAAKLGQAPPKQGPGDAQTPPEHSPGTDQTSDQMERIAELKDQVEYLRRELAVRTEEARRKDHLLAAALERVPPAIEPPQHAPAPPSGASGAEDAPQSQPSPGPSPTNPQDRSGGPERPFTEEETKPRERSWWRRFFGFE